MATPRYCLSALSRTTPLTAIRPTSPLTTQQIRAATNSANAAKYKRKDASVASKKKKASTAFTNHDLNDADQFALCDAMRSARPFLRPPVAPTDGLPDTSVPLKSAAAQHPPSTKCTSSYERKRTAPLSATGFVFPTPSTPASGSA